MSSTEAPVDLTPTKTEIVVATSIIAALCATSVVSYKIGYKSGVISANATHAKIMLKAIFK